MKKKERDKERQPILAVGGPLSGLVYIVLLPLKHVSAVTILVIVKAMRELSGAHYSRFVNGARLFMKGTPEAEKYRDCVFSSLGYVFLA